MALFVFGSRARVASGPWHYVSSLVRRHGYIVLVPEIGDEPGEQNPVELTDSLPKFTKITVENCMAAITKQTLDFETRIKQLVKNVKPSDSIFESMIKPLDKFSAPLNMTWGLSKALYISNRGLLPTKNYMSIHERAQRARSLKFNTKTIYDLVLHHLKHPNPLEPWTDEQKRVLQKFELEGRLNGLALEKPNEKVELYDYRKSLHKERDLFRAKVTLATKQFQHVVDDAVILTWPTQLKNALPNNNRVTLQSHVYNAVMELCPEREIRWNTWQAMMARGSGYAQRDLATSAHLQSIRSLRKGMANLLGYKSFAEMSMETKMAGSVDNVRSVFDQYVDVCAPTQIRELEDLFAFARDCGFKSNQLQLWDVPFWRRQHRIALYGDYGDLDANRYPLSMVLHNLFELCRKLFGICIRRRNDVCGWDEHVQYYEIVNESRDPGVSDTVLGSFYLDMFASAESGPANSPPHGGNGWMVAIRNRSTAAACSPLAALIFNFPTPVPNQDSLLSLRQMEALMRRFGQTLQHCLTTAENSEVAGNSNIEWDAVDVCAHFMCHWLYTPHILNGMIEEDEQGKLNALRKHMAATDLCSDMYLSQLDLELHDAPMADVFWYDIVRKLWPIYRHPFTLDKYDAHPCSFTQVFSDDSAANLYASIWSRMLAADVFSIFEEHANDSEVNCTRAMRSLTDKGAMFRSTFLSKGGALHPSEVFRQFTGRDPSPNALLTSLDILKPQ